MVSEVGCYVYSLPRSSISDEWPKWRKRFEQFRSASKLSTEPEPQQVDTLLYCLGDESDSVLSSTNCTAEERKSYSSVLAKFDGYFKVRRNVIFERARFNRRSQKEGATAEQYITELYNLAEFCNYGDLKEEMLRDRLVVGIRDVSLSERLQTDSDLTLEKTKTMVRQKAAVKEQRRELQQQADGGDAAVHRLRQSFRSKRGEGKPRHHQGGANVKRHPNLKGGPQSQRAEWQCGRCGQDKHKAGDRCPAAGATCHKCGRKGHYSSVCFSKAVSAVSSSITEAVFLGAIGEESSNTWLVDVQMQDQTEARGEFGAEVTAISEEMHRRLGQPKLGPPSKALFGPAHQKLDVMGEFTGQLKHGRRYTRQKVYVIPGLETNLLGLPAVTHLRLVSRVNATTSEEPESDIIKQYPKVFEGLGTIGDEYRIKIREDATPYSLFVPRNVPIPLRPKVKVELDRMERMGVISKIDTPTSWCAGMVVVPKKSGEVRICVDLKPLNESVLREPHPIPKVDELLALVAGATLFSKLDANSGFWQIPLTKESRPLTTFITPYGRYFFNKLPFGISCAPELFQYRMNRILEGLDGVVCLMDDVLIFGSNKEEHDRRLAAALNRVEQVGATLNKAKCAFHQSSIKFLGHILDKDGVHADPEKTSAIAKMEPPKSVSDLRRFMGLVNQLGKFSSQIAEISQPLRELLSTRREWTWGPDQIRSFSEIKTELTKPTVLAHYDPQAETKVSADASSFGLGAVLLQKNDHDWKVVAYASKSLSETEKRYAQIEKEALATTWACEKFRTYILGRSFTVETDHKPLVPLLNTKHLDDLPPRILRFRLRLAKYEYTAMHVPGRLLYAADALSRAPVLERFPDGAEEEELREEAEAYVHYITIPSLLATSQKLEKYRKAQMDDEECSQVREFCKTEVSSRQCTEAVLESQESTDRGRRHPAIQLPLRKDALTRIHEGHQGVEKCRWRTRQSVWWPGVVNQMQQFVENCRVCAREARPRKEPLMPTPLPDYPWQMVGTDLFELDKRHYLLVVDYFSRFPEVLQLTSTTSSAVITHLKAVFARHGIPETVRSDNGPQYASAEFKEFARVYEFQHITSSPRFPQSNGQVERMVQTVKRLIKQSDDPHLAVLSYRATPLPWCGRSPTELLDGRRLRTKIPQTRDSLIPNWDYLPQFRNADKQFKDKQKGNYDKRHRASAQSELPRDTEVVLNSEDHPTEGRVVRPAETPRSYVVQTPSGELRRNRSQLTVLPDQPQSSSEPDTGQENTTTTTTPPTPPTPPRMSTRSRTGISVEPPDRYSHHVWTVKVFPLT